MKRCPVLVWVSRSSAISPMCTAARSPSTSLRLAASRRACSYRAREPTNLTNPRPDEPDEPVSYHIRVRELEIRRLGVVPYPTANEMQRTLVEERRAGRVPDLLLLL